MFFWPSDRKRLKEIQADVAYIRVRLGGMTPADENEVAKQINSVSDRLDSFQRDPKKVISHPRFRKE